jgi:hypothetical protein
VHSAEDAALMWMLQAPRSGDQRAKDNHLVMDGAGTRGGSAPNRTSVVAQLAAYVATADLSASERDGFDKVMARPLGDGGLVVVP